MAFPLVPLIYVGAGVAAGTYATAKATDASERINRAGKILAGAGLLYIGYRVYKGQV